MNLLEHVCAHVGCTVATQLMKPGFMDKLVWATQLRRDCISVYASKFDRERHHAVSSCTPPPMLVPHDTKLPVLTVTVCHCRLDSTDSSSWHSLSALDRHQLSSQLSLQIELAQLSVFSEMTSSQLSLQVELAQLSVSHKQLRHNSHYK